MPGKRTWMMIALALALGGCASGSPSSAGRGRVGLANPASVNCIEKGGRLIIEKDGTGGEYGVCIFEGNRQCEEWALFRGNCPVGGIRVTGYATPAARYCAIRGGRYRTTSPPAAGRPEGGTCALPDGRICDVHDLYAGRCRANRK